jgi:hypothetical protein
VASSKENYSVPVHIVIIRDHNKRLSRGTYKELKTVQLACLASTAWMQSFLQPQMNANRREFRQSTNKLTTMLLVKAARMAKTAHRQSVLEFIGVYSRFKCTIVFEISRVQQASPN